MKRFFFSCGKSMKPAMSGFNIVWVVKPTQLSIGDIVVYSRQKDKLSTFCHRIIDQDETGNWLVKGDNDPQTDIVPPKNIYYKVDSWKSIF